MYKYYLFPFITQFLGISNITINILYNLQCQNIYHIVFLTILSECIFSFLKLLFHCRVSPCQFLNGKFLCIIIC